MATPQELHEIFEPLREHAYNRSALVEACDELMKGRQGNGQIYQVVYDIKGARDGARVEELLDELQASAEADTGVVTEDTEEPEL
jgi:hypothetical protein